MPGQSLVSKSSSPNYDMGMGSKTVYSFRVAGVSEPSDFTTCTKHKPKSENYLPPDMRDLIALNTGNMPLLSRDPTQVAAPRIETDIHSNNIKTRIQGEKIFLSTPPRNHRRYTDIHDSAHKVLYHDPVVNVGSSPNSPCDSNRSYQRSTHFVMGDGKFHGGEARSSPISKPVPRAGKSCEQADDDRSSFSSKSSHISNTSTPTSRRMLAMDRKKNALSSHWQFE